MLTNRQQGMLPPPPGRGSPSSRRNSPIFEGLDGMPGEIDEDYRINNGAQVGSAAELYSAGPNVKPKDRLAVYRDAALVRPGRCR